MRYAALIPRPIDTRVVLNEADDEVLQRRARQAVARAIEAGCRPRGGWSERADTLAAAKHLNSKPRAKVIGLRIPSLLRRQGD